MIRRIQALNYRCLRHVDVRLDRFHVLVGPNASGKSTLFDAVAFLGDLVSDGLDAAVENRTRNFQDLVWGRPKTNPWFQLAVELAIPEHVKKRLPEPDDFQVFRYEMMIQEDEYGLHIESERGLLARNPAASRRRRTQRFPDPRTSPATIFHGGARKGSRTILRRADKGICSYRSETSRKNGRTWRTSAAQGRTKPALSAARTSESEFPMASHTASLLEDFTGSIVLDSLHMRRSSPLKKKFDFSTDGSSLPWAVKYLQERHESDYREWLLHVQAVLPDLEAVRVVEREDDRHAYLMLQYADGVKVPSWTTSDGTLNLLALTLLAYLPAGDPSARERAFPNQGIFLIEEPENGVHPLALDAIYDSLSSVYDGQVLVITHSPAFLRLARPEETLCFGKTSEGATDVVRGDERPFLRDWRESADMNLLFATGVIG